MSRAERRREKRSGVKGVLGRSDSRARSVIPWIVGAGVVAVALVGVWTGVDQARGGHHPDPRPEITDQTVVPAARYESYPRVHAVYAQVAEVAAVIDGIYCYCDCSQHSGHRSLLTCFESDHAAACDVCMTEAAVAFRMTSDGGSLDEIREAIDDFYGG